MLDDEDDAPSVDADSVRREEAVSKAVRAVVAHDMTYADAGDLVGYSAGWVSDRMAEYREGKIDEDVNDAVA